MTMPKSSPPNRIVTWHCGECGGFKLHATKAGRHMDPVRRRVRCPGIFEAYTYVRGPNTKETK